MAITFCFSGQVLFFFPLKLSVNFCRMDGGRKWRTKKAWELSLDIWKFVPWKEYLGLSQRPWHGRENANLSLLIKKVCVTMRFYHKRGCPAREWPSWSRRSSNNNSRRIYFENNVEGIKFWTRYTQKCLSVWLFFIASKASLFSFSPPGPPLPPKYISYLC